MQRYFAIDKLDKQVILNDTDIYHIKKVMRMQKDDLIEVVYDNKLYQAYIQCLKPFKIEIIKELIIEKDNIPKITLIIPFLKEQKLDLIFQKGTEIGINSFIVIPFKRSMIKYDERKEKVKLLRWQKICKEAAEQSMRIDIPLINIEKSWDFIDNINGLKLICSTNEKNNYIKNVLKNKCDCDMITLVIGPEGGITAEEEAYLEEKDFNKVTLGKQIMRVETVPIFLASIIKYEFF